MPYVHIKQGVPDANAGSKEKEKCILIDMPIVSTL